MCPRLRARERRGPRGGGRAAAAQAKLADRLLDELAAAETPERALAVSQLVWRPRAYTVL